MPDFEALIRHQQLQQPTNNQRLKVVDKPDSTTSNSEHTEISQSRLLINIAAGFVGSVIGTLTILFLYINDYLPLDLLKLK